MKQLICLSYAPWSARPNRTEQLLTRLEDVQILFFEPPEPRGTPAREALRVRPNILVYTLPAPLWGAGSALLQQVTAPMQKPYAERKKFWSACEKIIEKEL